MRQRAQRFCHAWEWENVQDSLHIPALAAQPDQRHVSKAALGELECTAPYRLNREFARTLTSSSWKIASAR